MNMQMSEEMVKAYVATALFLPPVNIEKFRPIRRLAVNQTLLVAPVSPCRHITPLKRNSSL